MPSEEADAYYQLIRVIKAREMLEALTVSDFPNLKASRRRKLHSSLAAKSRLPKSKKVATTDQIAELLAGRLIDGAK